LTQRNNHHPFRSLGQLPAQPFWIRKGAPLGLDPAVGVAPHVVDFCLPTGAVNGNWKTTELSSKRHARAHP